MKKLILLPESKYLQLTEGSNSRGNAFNVLQAVQHPEQREMIKKYNLTHSILSDAGGKPRDVKMSEYRDAMNDFSVLRDQVKYVPTPKAISDDRAVDDAVNLMPATLQSNAKMLMDRLKEEDGVISWTSKGEVSIHGQRLPGTNITDLVGDVIRSTRTEMPERERFLNVLAELNTPETLIRNKSALEQYRRIKNRGAIKRPPGLPEADEGVMLPSMRKKKKSKVNKMQKIDWNNT